MTGKEETFSEETKRCFRIISMINEVGTEVLWQCLKSQLGGQDLDLALGQAKVKIKIQESFSKRKIDKQQFDLLYPGPTNKDRLDVTMLSFLIRYLHPTLAQNDTVWTRPSVSDMSLPAEVTRLRNKRNKWCHLDKNALSISEKDFQIEFSELRTIMCRMAQKVGGPMLSSQIVADKLDKIRSKNFGVSTKASSTETSTNTSDSLDNISKEVESSEKATSCSSLNETVRDDNLAKGNSEIIQAEHNDVFNVEIVDESNCIEPSERGDCNQTLVKMDCGETSGISISKDESLKKGESKDVSTSCSSLTQQRKLSFKVKSYIEPFVFNRPKANIVSEIDMILPRRVKERPAKPRTDSRCACTCEINYSIRRRQTHVIELKHDHSNLKHKCRIDGITVVSRGRKVLTDTFHNRVLLFTNVATLIDEFECESPCGICTVDIDRVAVLQRTSETVLLLSAENEKLIEESRINIPCNGWHCDVVSCKSNLYILCETGEIHEVHIPTKTQTDVIKTDIPGSLFFDISSKGDFFYVSTDKVFCCVNKLGRIIWQIESKRVRQQMRDTFKGIAVSKKSIFVCLWEAHTIVELSLSGKIKKLMPIYSVQYPWAITASKRELFISQYMSGIDQCLCQEIVIIKV